MARYELVERIGVGGMAEIFRGLATADGGFEKPVAIKKILPHLSQDKRFVELLITEAKTLSQLRHRNIVQIYDVGLGDDGQYFLVMEYVDGLDCGAVFEALEKRSRRMPLDVAMYVTGEVCEALEHAHRARAPGGESLGLVHRDVSPSNILLSRSGEVKLTDFGIAKRTEEATGHGGVRGKFAYISPEQAHNTHVDARSDVYSLGIVFYELVTGHRLFSNLADFDALRAVREGRSPRPRDVDPDIDDALERILLGALAPRPDDRFATAAAFGAQLRSYRYSIATTGGDPTVDTARIVEEHEPRRERRREPRSELLGEQTFVRISTVVGFGGFEISEETTGGGPITGELPGARAGDINLEDEDTRAVRLAEARPGSVPLDDAETRVRSHLGHSGFPASSTGEFDLSDSPTSVVSYDRPQLLDRPMPTSTAALAALVPGMSTLRVTNPSADGNASSGAGPGRSVDQLHGSDAAPIAHGGLTSDAEFSLSRVEGEHAPKTRQRGGRLSFLRQREPRPSGPPILLGKRAPSRRRAVLIASGAAILLAVIAFVAAGALFNEGDASSASAPADAGALPDASITMPPVKVDRTSDRRRRTRKRPAKKPPDKSTKPTKTDKSTKPTKTDKNAKPTKTDKSTKPTKTDKSTKPTKTDKNAASTEKRPAERR